MTKNGWTTALSPRRTCSSSFCRPMSTRASTATAALRVQHVLRVSRLAGMSGVDRSSPSSRSDATFSCSGADEPPNPQGFPNGRGDRRDGEHDQPRGERGDHRSRRAAPAGTSTPAGTRTATCAHGGSALPSERRRRPAVQPGDQRPRLLAAAGVQQHRQRRRGRLPSSSAARRRPRRRIADPDTGPLDYAGGPVMRSVTRVHDLLDPDSATPAISVAPTVSGTAAVSQQLSTTTERGRIRRRATSTSGSAATTPARAASISRTPRARQYTLVAADAGHKIRSEVLASNANGPASAYVPSAPTSVVFPKPILSKLPKVSGSAHVGNSLSVSNGRLEVLADRLRVPVAPLQLVRHVVQEDPRRHELDVPAPVHRRRPQVRGKGHGDERRGLRDRRLRQQVRPGQELRTFLAGLLVLGALAVGLAPSGVGASDGFRPSGVVLHSADARACRDPPRTQSGHRLRLDLVRGVRDRRQRLPPGCRRQQRQLEQRLSAATQYSDSTGSIAYSSTFGGTYLDTNGFPANDCPSLAASICLRNPSS